MLMNIIYFENFCGKDLLEKLVIVEGIMALWGFDNMFEVKTKLLSYLGEKYSAELIKEGSETNSLLEKYCALNNFEPDKASPIGSDANRPALNQAFTTLINSSVVLKNLSMVYVLRKEKPDVLKYDFGKLSDIIYDFIDDVLMSELWKSKSLDMRFDQVKLLAMKLQALYDDCFCWNEALESIPWPPELMYLKGKEHYDINGFKKVVREFFMVILAVISEKRWYDNLQYEFFREIIRHCVLEEKPAIEVVEAESLKLLLRGLEKSVFKCL